jgi:hypothetical protein
MNNIRQQILSEILEIYDSTLKYKFKKNIQEIDFTPDIDRLRKEVFDLIIKYDHGFNQVSIRGPKGNPQWEDNEEAQLLYDKGIEPLGTYEVPKADELYNHEDITEWHPGIAQDSYFKQLTPLIEEATGLNISAITLCWALPESRQMMHIDIEPIRLHIPILTNSDVWFLTDREAHFMEYGKLYHLLAISDHAIHNYGPTPRLHVIFSTYPNTDISDKLKKLSKLDTLKENIFSSVVGGGIDNYSVKKLSKIHDSKKNENLQAFHNRGLHSGWAKILNTIIERLK